MENVWCTNQTAPFVALLFVGPKAPVAMVMQYFFRIAHIDSQRRKRLSRSEKKMCACTCVCERLKERNGGWAEEEQQGERTKASSSLVFLHSCIKSVTCTIRSHHNLVSAMCSHVVCSDKAPSLTWVILMHVPISLQNAAKLLFFCQSKNTCKKK